MTTFVRENNIIIRRSSNLPCVSFPHHQDQDYCFILKVDTHSHFSCSVSRKPDDSRNKNFLLFLCVALGFGIKGNDSSPTIISNVVAVQIGHLFVCRNSDSWNEVLKLNFLRDMCLFDKS